MRRLVTKWFGSVVLDGDRVVARSDFPADATSIAQRLAAMREGRILDEERALAAPDVAVVEPRLRPLGRLDVASPTPAVPAPPHADTALLHQASLLAARQATRQAHGERDRHLVHAVRTLDDLHKSVNTLGERLTEWYGLHYPEALARAGSAEKLAALVAQAPSRADVAARLGDPSPDASVGVDLGAAELGVLQGYAAGLSALYQERARLEKAIEHDAKAVVPTLAGIVGPLLAAQLVARAGGLERLAFLPAGTIQTLGAEEALFMHLRDGKKPPKHGVLYQHPLVHQSPPWNHGRISRTMANYAARAARLDHFGPGPTDHSPTMRPEMEKKINKLRARPRPAPPAHATRGAPVGGGPAHADAPRRPRFQPRPKGGRGGPPKPFRRRP